MNPDKLACVYDVLVDKPLEELTAYLSMDAVDNEAPDSC